MSELETLGNNISQIGGNNAVSNAQLNLMEKIAEAKAQKIARTLVTEYCISMNKKMVTHVGTIVDRLDINNQAEIFEKVAEQFFDDDLTDMYVSELKATMKVQIRKNLRGILYDHFKLDLEEEKKKEAKLEEAAGQEGGEDAAGAPPKEEGAEGEEGVEGEEGEEGEEQADEGGEESAAAPAGMDGAEAMDKIIEKINDKILTDDSFVDEAKKGILSNLESGEFKMALQREVFNRLVPLLENLMKDKISAILNNDELKNAAMDVVKGQQKLYNAQFKKGGKKHTTRKYKNYGGKHTRKSTE
jgi:hypothetical protein